MAEKLTAAQGAYPLEFLGRCVFCLDNAYLSGPECVWGFQPECVQTRCRDRYDAKRLASLTPHTQED